MKMSDVIDLSSDDEIEAHKTPINQDSTHDPYRFPEMVFYLNRNSSRHSNDDGLSGVSLNEILEDFTWGTIEHLIIFNFMIDFPWMLEECPAVLRSRQITIFHNENDAVLEPIKHISQKKSNFVRFHRIHLPIPYGSFHPKVFLIQYENALRVCVSSANLLFRDWWLKTQSVYVQDFPRNQIHLPGSTDNIMSNPPLRRKLALEFSSSLIDFLTACGGPGIEISRQVIPLFDFSSTRVALIPSSPGSFTGPSRIKKWGAGRLGQLVSEEEPVNVASSKSSLIYQTSSLGSMHENFFKEFAAVCGFSSPEKIKIIIPSVHQVRESTEGWAAGGSIPVTSTNVLKSCVASRLHKWESSGPLNTERIRHMPHIKTLIAVEHNSKTNRESIHWLVTGSHNLSRAAWGDMSWYNNDRHTPKLFVRSFEMSIFCSRRTISMTSHDIQNCACKSGFIPCSKPFLFKVHRTAMDTMIVCPEDIESHSNNLTSLSSIELEAVSSSFSDDDSNPEDNPKRIKLIATEEKYTKKNIAQATNKYIGVLPVPFSLLPKPYPVQQPYPPLLQDQVWQVDISDGQRKLGRDSLGLLLEETAGMHYGFEAMKEKTVNAHPSAFVFYK